MSEIPKDPLKAILLESECHFTWNLLKEDILFDVEDTIGQQLEFVTTESRLTLYNLLAYVKHLKGQNEDALECLEQAEHIIQREHSDKEVRHLVNWGNYAWVYYHMDQLKEAQKHLDKIGTTCKKLSSPSDYKLDRPEIDCERGWALLKFEESITTGQKRLLRRPWKRNLTIQNLTSVMPSQCTGWTILPDTGV